jgi:hypothetical protein
MRQKIDEMIDSLGGLIASATHIIVRVAGEKKNGFSQQIHVAVHFKEKVVCLSESLKKFTGGEDGTNFYHLVTAVGHKLSEKLASSLGFIGTRGGGTRRTDKRKRRAIAGAKRYNSHLHGDLAPA